MTYRGHPNSSSPSSGFSSSCLTATLHLASLVFVERTYLHNPLCGYYNTTYYVNLYIFLNTLQGKTRVLKGHNDTIKSRVSQNFAISRSQLKILGGTRVKDSEFQIRDPPHIRRLPTRFSSFGDLATRILHSW